MSGRDERRYVPNDAVSREQIATLLVRTVAYAEGRPVVPAERGHFTDVPVSGTHAQNVAAAAERGLVTGNDGQFRPLASTRRDQTATLIINLLGVVRGAGPVVTDGGELWVLDQGTDLIHVYDATSGIEEVATVDVRPAVLRAARAAGDITDAPAGELTVPHMIEFDSQQRYAFIASTAGGVVIIVDARTKEVVEVLATGGGTHMADVTPDDSALWVSVIGTAGRGSNGSQKLVEVALPDLDAADPTFAVTDTLLVEDLVAPWEDGTEASYAFPSLSAVCHQFSPDSSEAWITLGPGWSQGGLLVFDLDTKELLETNPSEGLDTHGLRLSPDGSEYWQVNRNSDDAIVIDADTLEVTRRISDVAATPDILGYSRTAPDRGVGPRWVT